MFKRFCCSGVGIGVSDATFMGRDFLEMCGDAKTGTGEKKGCNMEEEWGMFLFREAMGRVEGNEEEA